MALVEPIDRHAAVMFLCPSRRDWASACAAEHPEDVKTLEALAEAMAQHRVRASILPGTPQDVPQTVTDSSGLQGSTVCAAGRISGVGGAGEGGGDG